LTPDRPYIFNRLEIGDRLSVSLVRWRVSVKPLRARQAEATRSLLIAVARQNFTEHGYAATSIDDIIQQAGVARGALYHHFSGKEALFRAVYETVEDEVFSQVMEAAASQASPWEAVRAGLSAFLDACLEPAFRRIVVLDSVSVLQSQVLEVGIDPVELPMLRTVLTPLLGTTTFGGIAIDALTHVALGGLYGASLYIARAPDPRAARAEVDLVLDTLIAGLLRPASA
jgi:AcrR family transcriptional regulator